jgi:hypothetical protein
VIVWSDKTTGYYGNIFSQGGIAGGNGGFVEVSGKENLGFAGFVNTLAPQGKAGTLLLDPRNITIATGGTATLTDVDQFSETPSADLIIAPSTINGASSNVILQANRDIIFSNDVSMTGSGLSLTAQAARTITVNANITTNNGNITFIANDSTSGANSTNRTTTAGNITMASGTTLNAGTGNISLTIDPSSTSPFNPGTMTLRGLSGTNITATNTASTITFNGNVTASNNVAITAGNTISQAASTALTGSSLTAKTLRTAGAAITLGNSGNNFTSVDLQARNATDTANAAGAITYRDVDGFNISNAIASTSTVTLTAGGLISQNTGAGTGIFGTTLTVKTLNDSGAAINLNNPLNAATTINLQARNAADSANVAGAINYTDADGVAVSGINTESTLSLTAGGSITQTGVLTVSNTPTFTVTAANSDILMNTSANRFTTTPIFTVSGSGSIRDLGLRNTLVSAAIPTLPTGLRNLTLIFDAAAMSLPGISLTGSLTATANGAITQSGAFSGITLTAKTLNDAGSAITLGDIFSNEFTTVNLQSRNAADSADASGDISYRDATGFDLTALHTTTNAALTSGGAITDSTTG